MRDPRNWVRPAAAAVVGVSAGTALVALRVRCTAPLPAPAVANLFELAARTLRDAADEARRLSPER